MPLAHDNVVSNNSAFAGGDAGTRAGGVSIRPG